MKQSKEIRICSYTPQRLKDYWDNCKELYFVNEDTYNPAAATFQRPAVQIKEPK